MKALHRLPLLKPFDGKSAKGCNRTVCSRYPDSETSWNFWLGNTCAGR